jgi:hypothetical protein
MRKAARIGVAWRNNVACRLKTRQSALDLVFDPTFAARVELPKLFRGCGYQLASQQLEGDRMTVLRQDVGFRSVGENLAGTIFYPETAPSPAVLICHGAGEFRENYFELAEFLAERGVAAMPVDMHGHGGSGGERYHVNMQHWAALGGRHPRSDRFSFKRPQD